MPAAAIIGVGQTAYESRKDKSSLQEVIFDGASRALSDAGLRRQDVDSIVIASQDLVDGRGISNMQNAGPAGSYLKDEIRVANDGIYGLILAALQIMAGRSRLALVISWAKSSESDLDAVSTAEFEPFFERPLGLTGSVALAIQAARMVKERPQARRAASAVVAQARKQAALNQGAHLREPVTIEEVETSAKVSWPLCALDLCPKTDGACAIILASAEQANRSRHRPVWVDGAGWESDIYGLGERDISAGPALRRAAERAYHEAKITPADIDVAEFTAQSSFEHLIVMEQLGFCRDAVAATLDHAPATMKAKLNPSGGTLATNPISAVGLIRAAEVALQLMGRAGGHQVANAKLGLAHGSSGQCLQSNGVVVLRGA